MRNLEVTAPRRSFLQAVKDGANKALEMVKGAALAVVAMGAMALGGVQEAMATPTLAGEATAALNTAESDITGILIILVGVVFLFVLYSLIKRAK